VVSNSFALTPDVIYFQFYTPIAVGVWLSLYIVYNLRLK
jgi:hypothetical protein